MLLFAMFFACNSSSPVVTITSPSDGAVVPAAFEVEANATSKKDIASLALASERGVLGITTVSAGVFAVPEGTLDDGEHILEVTATDLRDKQGEASITVTVDGTPPEVRFDAPGDGDRVGDVVVLEGEVTDAIGLATATLLVDGEEVASLEAGPFSESVDTGAWATGSHEVVLSAVDLAGNEAETQLELEIDRVPTVVITRPDDGDTVNGDVTLSADADDDVGIARVEIYADGARKVSDTTEPYAGTWDTCTGDSGPIEILARATDDAGQTTETSIVVTVDQALEVDFLGGGMAEPEHWLGAWVSSDDPVQEVEISVDGVVVASVTDPSAPPSGTAACAFTCSPCDTYGAVWDTSAVADGEHNVRVVVTDTNGGSATDTGVVTVDHDRDDDGFVSPDYDGDDCDDADATIFPGADERCDGVDDDCDGDVDEIGAVDGSSWYTDADLDGYGDPATTPVIACSALAGTSDDPTDCDDTEPAMNPGLTESCYDGLDNDCDGTDNGCELVGDVDVDTTAWSTHLGIAAADALGYRVAFVGDLDGDGLEDALFAGLWEVWAISGPVATGTDWVTSATIAELKTTSTINVSGLIGNVDWNADGVNDVAIAGIPYSGIPYGDVWLLSGTSASGTVTLDTAAFATVSGASIEALGSAVAASDADGDGAVDLAATASYQSDVLYAGAAYLFDGPIASSIDSSAARLAIQGTTERLLLGTDVSLGDTDGDGVDEIAVSTIFEDSVATDGGSVRVFTSALTGTVYDSDADATVLGSVASANLGRVVELEDVDADGLAELVITVPFGAGATTGSGAVLIYEGASLSGSLSEADAGVKVVGVRRGSSSGLPVFAADVEIGDWDRDGAVDLVVGAPGDDGTVRGGVYVVPGPFSGTVDATTTSLLHVAGSTSFGQYLGYDADSLALGGDLDGDGVDDLIIGQRHYAYVSSDSGAVFVVPGGSL